MALPFILQKIVMRLNLILSILDNTGFYKKIVGPISIEDDTSVWKTCIILNAIETRFGLSLLLFIWD